MKKVRPSAWQQSTQWREISRAAIRRWNAQRPSLPKCGAARKRDGEPCQNLPLANGRCRFHGGRTPKGDHWHSPVWPNGKAPDAEQKLRRKLRDLERARRKRKLKLAAMPPAERERYERWQRNHQPGDPARRAEGRQRRQEAAEFRAHLERPRPAPVSDELAELQRRREELERRLAQLAADQGEGVFG